MSSFTGFVSDDHKGNAGLQKIDQLLKKLRDTQSRILDEKSHKWGFDFRQGVPLRSSKPENDIKSDTEDAQQINWLPLV